MNKEQIIAVILIGSGLIVGSVLVYKFQGPNLNTGTREGIGSLEFTDGESSGDVVTYDLSVSTGDPEKDFSVPISSISVKARINTGKNVDVSFVDDMQSQINALFIPKNVMNNENWLFPVNSIYEDDGKYYLEFVAVNTSDEGFSSLTPFILGKVIIRSSTLDKPTISIIKEFTKMMSKDKPVINILP